MTEKQTMRRMQALYPGCAINVSKSIWHYGDNHDGEIFTVYAGAQRAVARGEGISFADAMNNIKPCEVPDDSADSV